MRSQEQLPQLLNTAYNQYANSEFIDNDPVQVPHKFLADKDIEVAAFLSATIAWGQRKSIVKNANMLMERMDYAPFDFVSNFSIRDYQQLSGFVHRTFNTDDLLSFLLSLQRIYRVEEGLQGVFVKGYQQSQSIKGALEYFRHVFTQGNFAPRSHKHVADVSRGSAGKRLNMFLRWMVRTDREGVDFGLWTQIPTSALMIPLDTHSGRVARELGLLSRAQNDWSAVEQLTQTLREFDPDDPVRFDYALFGIGIAQKNNKSNTFY
ncbi:MAG: TIGR02757 family protein [Bacteroidales bacterium]|nr:TIGR02757 family protein [Bacteroidales bacterium]MBN2750397.1 TIGR02757 family protein [Bacteroidales bacterium]